MKTETAFRPSSRCSRRRFLQTAAAAAGPLVLPAGMRAADTSAAGRRRIGFVGMGKQSDHLLRSFINQDDVEVVAVCDVDTTRREHALKTVTDFYADAKRKPAGWKGCEAYNEFERIVGRDDIDAVCIATPDHWHAVVTVAALDSGKDIYCEKPLTHNIHEAVEVMEAVERNGCVLQTGSMQRSMTEFRVACELVRNGCIGEIERVECSFGDPGRPCDLAEEAMEKGLDWERWCGPGPLRPYSSVLSPRGVHNHFPSWRDYMEYGGGMVTDWGAHHLDIAQWGLGMDESGPVKASPPEGWEAWKSKRGAVLTYANGVTVHHRDGVGVHFFGTKGEVMVNRGRFALKIGDEFVARFLGDDKDDRGASLGNQLVKAEREVLGENPEVTLYRSQDHIRDFLDAAGRRSKPITSEIVGGRTAICCHLMNLAYYHGETIEWDPAENAFAGGTGKAEWLTRDYRGGWEV